MRARRLMAQTLALFLGLTHWATFADAPPEPNATSEAVRLPSIRSGGLSLPKEVLNRPEISLEDLTQCMGAEHSLKAELQALAPADAQLAQEREGLQAEHARLQGEQQAMEAKRQAVDQAFVQANRVQEAVARSAAQLDRLRAQVSPQVPQQVADFNARVAQHNAERLRGQKLGQSAMALQASFLQQVGEFNARAQAQNAHADAWRARWQAQADALRQLQARATALHLDCGGRSEEHTS